MSEQSWKDVEKQIEDRNKYDLLKARRLEDLERRFRKFSYAPFFLILQLKKILYKSSVSPLELFIASSTSLLISWVISTLEGKV